MDLMNQIQSVIHEHTKLPLPISSNTDLAKLNISIEKQHLIKDDLAALTGIRIHFNTPVYGSVFDTLQTIHDYIADMLIKKGN